MVSIRSIPGWREMTGAELVAFCAANPQTAQPVPVAALQNFLRLNRLSWIDVDGKATGAIPDLVRTGGLSEALRLQVEGLLSKSFRESSPVIETDSGDYKNLLSTLIGQLGLPAEKVADFYALAGGRKYPLYATAEQAEAARDRELLIDRWAAVSAVVSDKVHDGIITDWQGVVDAVEAG